MYNKKLRKIFAACALATALTMAAGSISASAAVTPASGSKTGIDPTAVDNSETDGVNEGYSDTEIPVYGYTNDKTVYSVDVEWGAMTFEYEASSWNPETHEKIAGAGWKVYNSETNEVITDSQHAINRVTIINHSNAPVYAQLSYISETGYNDTTGTFAKSTAASTEDVKADWTDTDSTNHSTGYFTLQTASTDASGGNITDDSAGTPSKGNVYFTPKNIAANATIDQWSTIGKINVEISTTEPTS